MIFKKQFMIFSLKNMIFSWYDLYIFFQCLSASMFLLLSIWFVFSQLYSNEYSIYHFYIIIEDFFVSF